MRTRSGEVAGTLHVWAPLSFGREYLAPALADFHAQHPKLRVSLTLSDLRHCCIVLRENEEDVSLWRLHAVSARVRLFLALLKARLQPVPPWHQLQAWTWPPACLRCKT